MVSENLVIDITIIYLFMTFFSEWSLTISPQAGPELTHHPLALVWRASVKGTCYQERSLRPLHLQEVPPLGV